MHTPILFFVFGLRASRQRLSFRIDVPDRSRRFSPGADGYDAGVRAERCTGRGRQAFGSRSIPLARRNCIRRRQRRICRCIGAEEGASAAFGYNSVTHLLRDAAVYFGLSV